LRRAAVRLAVQTAGLIALVVLTLEAVALLVVLRSQSSAERDLLRQTVARADDVTDPPAGAWLTIKTATREASSRGLPGGFPDRESMDAAVRTGADQTRTAQVGGRDYLVVTSVRGQWVVQGVLDLSADRAERNRLALALGVSGVLGLALAAGSGVFLAGRAMKPTAQALALQRRFVADASHELRTPLTLLSTRAQLVRRDVRANADAATVAREVDGLVADARNLANVLEDLLIAADPRSNQRHERVDVGQLAHHVAAAAAASARADGVQVGCEVEGDTVVQDASSTALRRALTALVDNAVRHARTDVTVTVRGTPTNVVVRVQDDGQGIQAELLPRLFERYESSQPPGSARRSYGLGLALVSEVAAGHGGSVTARNIDRSGDGGSGALLEFTLPKAGSRRRRRGGGI
jgi:two-component system, OmpR family, sensor kinase